jgi:predicted AlkP superfamily phosphohydrolase/phosphomutase
MQKRKTNLLAVAAKLGITPSNLAVLLKKFHLYEIVLRNLIKSDMIVDAAFQYDRPIDMKNSVAFAKAEGIFINRDVVGDSYEKTREEIMRKLEKIVDGGKPIVSKVYRREEVMNGQYIDRAPDILFILHDGYCPTYYSDGSNAESVGEDKGGYKGGTANTGIHRPEGIFMSYGTDIREHKLKGMYRVWDIAPTILHMVNLPVPSFMDGKVMKEVFKPESAMAVREVKIASINEANRIRSRLQALQKNK